MEQIFKELKNQCISIVGNILSECKRVAIVDVPDHSNVGDSLIYLGELELLRCLGKTVVSATCLHTYRKQVVLKARPDVILIHGGGNLGDLWERHQVFRERILEDFSEMKVVQMPQSIFFQSEENFQKFIAKANIHKNFHILVRDLASRDLIVTKVNRSLLCPDIAFCVGIKNPPKPTNDITYLIRTDKESSIKGIGNLRKEIRDRMDWIETNTFIERINWFRKKMFMSKKCSHVLPVNLLNQLLLRIICCLQVFRGVRILSLGKTVVTDRLHAVILSLLIGRYVIYADNNYGKVHNVIKLWLKESECLKRLKDDTLTEAMIKDICS